MKTNFTKSFSQSLLQRALLPLLHSVLMVILLLGFTSRGFAQPAGYAFRLEANSNFGSPYVLSNNNPAPGILSVLVSANGTANEYIVEWDGFANKWTNTVTPKNTVTTFFWGGGNFNGPNGSLTGGFIVNKHYTLQIRGLDYSNRQGVIMETDNAPVSFAVSSPVVGPTNVCTGTDASITINLGIAKSSQERVFVRYSSTSNFASSKVVEAIGVGSNWSSATAAIPGADNSSGTIYYYAYSTTVASDNTTDHDLVTLKFGNNGGSNFSYSIDPVPTWYLDADNDNYYTGSGITQCASPGSGYRSTGLLGAGDCNDAVAAINPGAAEICSNNIDDNCNGVIDENNITTPVGVIQGPAGVCRGAAGQEFSVAAVPGASSYQWTIPTGATGSSSSNSIVLNFSATYNMGLIAVKAIGSCNETALSARQIQAFTSKPGTPKFIQGKNLGTCVGNEMYSIPAVANATNYTWVAPANTTIVNGQGTPDIELSFGPLFVGGILSVTASNCMGTSAARSMVVRTKPATPAAIVGPASVCPGAVGVQFSTTGLAGITYNWVVPADATITAGQGTSAITVTWGNTAGNVRVSATNVCGTSAFRSKAVSLDPCITIAQAELVQAEPGANKLEVKLWPNPARDVLMITLDAFEPGKKIELTLMQADGKVQTAQSLMPTMRGQQVRMDVSRSAAGLYLLQARQGTLTETKRVVILR